MERDELNMAILRIFCILPRKTPKNENVGKMKNFDGDIILLHMCTKNHDNMMYVS